MIRHFDVSCFAHSIAAPLCVTICTFFLSGCLAFYSDKNRPGDTDVTQPPPEQHQRERVYPSHPGAFYITTQLSPFTEFGGTFGPARIGSWETHQIGVELAAGMGTTDDPPLGFGAAMEYPTMPFMLAVGWLPYSSQTAFDHHVYTELRTPLVFVSDEHPAAFRLAVGWSGQPTVLEHGPQLTLIFSDFLYLRANNHIGHSWSATAGARIPLGVTWVRSL